METSTDTTQDPARCQQPIVRLLRLYAPKHDAEALLYRMDWQKDPLPKAGIWEAIGAEELDADPLIHLRCLAPWDERFPFMHTLKVREKLMALCFERVEIVRSPLQPNDADETRER